MSSSHKICSVTCLRFSSRWTSAQSGSAWWRWPCLVPTAVNSRASSAASVSSAGNGQPSPAIANRCSVNRMVDGARLSRRAISLPDTPAAVKRSTSRTWRIAVLSASIRSSSAQSQRADPKRASRGAVSTPPIRATSSRNGGRNHLGTPSDIKSDWRVTSSRIRGRLPSESAINPHPNQTQRPFHPRIPSRQHIRLVLSQSS